VWGCSYVATGSCGSLVIRVLCCVLSAFIKDDDDDDDFKITLITRVHMYYNM